MHFALGLLAPDRPNCGDSRSRSRTRPALTLRLSTEPERESWADAANPFLYFLAVASGLANSVAWLVPETTASALLGWLGACLLVCTVRARRVYLPAYCCGVIGHAVAFYWVYRTVSVFGGFGVLASALIFAMFVLWGALLLLVFAVIHHNLGPVVDGLALRSPIAVVVAELISIRLFPWHFGHSQIAFTPFVQLAGIGGAMLVSFVLFWSAEVLVRMIVFRERRRAFLLPVLVFAASLGYGGLMMRTFASPPGLKQKVLIVQGNSELTANRDLESAQQNLTRLQELTRQAAGENDLIVWPEGAIPAYIPADIGSVRDEPMLPWLANGSAFLVGGYSYRGGEERYNTAFAVYRDGSVPLPYFKQILIPFGEYMPCSDLFPWLGGMNQRAGTFTAGTKVRVFGYPMRRRDGQEYTLKLSPLICYEDTVPRLARKATRQGAELLVNLTYDTWFGRSAAPFQHHLIAAFRAIENRRYLIRATNTGYSAVVDPLGRTIARIPPFTEGTVAVDVSLLNYPSAYTRYVGERPWWGLFFATLGLIVVRRWRDRGSNELLVANTLSHF
ncbi:MAG: apolipoprotein N-acyltransferase [Isosphaerales bacterium]